ncbi:MAG: hypothetical protein AAF597_10745 [Bacteroidota bacterium]
MSFLNALCSLLTGCFLFVVTPMVAQSPNWSPPSPQDFDNPNTMTAVVVVEFDGALSENPADQVAVFANGQLHGLGEMLDYTGFGLPANIYYSITVYGNAADNGQPMEFRVYHAATDRVYSSSTVLPFVFTEQFGNFGAPMEVQISADGLPIELGDLSAIYRDKSVLLNWETIRETDNAGFVIERSTNAGQFNAIGYVAGLGNSSNLVTYSYRDLDILEEQPYFYRLRQQDFDGTESLSSIVQVIPAAPGFDVQLYPNPVVADELYLQSTAGRDQSLRLSLLNAQGQALRHWSLPVSGAELSPLSLRDLPTGQYFLWIEIEGGNSVVRSLYKQ